MRLLVVLLALAIFINALDRGNFATAAPLIKDDLRLSNTQVGLLLSAFFWTYVPGHILSGWLIERFNAYRTLAASLALWSMATLLTGFAGSFAVMLVLRLLLGLGESSTFPSISKLLAVHLPGARLASANGIVGAGLMLGNGAGMVLSGLVLAHFGWHAMFFIFGIVSLLWLLPWQSVTGGAMPKVASTQPMGEAPSYRRMLSRRETWAAMIGMFSGNYPYFLVLSWLPLYLVKQQGYSITEMAAIGGLVYVLAALGNIYIGRYADHLIARGVSASRVRKSGCVISSVVAFVCMLACAFGTPEQAVASLILFSFSPGFGTFSVFSTGQTLAGPRAAGKWIGLQNGAGGLAGVIGQIVTGVLIDATGTYRSAFLFAAVIAAIGIFSWGMMIRKVEPLDWDRA